MNAPEAFSPLILFYIDLLLSAVGANLEAGGADFLDKEVCCGCCTPTTPPPIDTL